MAPKVFLRKALDFQARKVTSRFRLPYGRRIYARRWLVEPKLDFNRMSFPVNHGRLKGRGFRIIQLSDIHLGTYVGDEQLCWLAHRLRALEPDLLFMTGDFVNRSYREAIPAQKGLHALASIAPTYGVLGNHDFWHGPEELAHLLTKAGVRMLRNEHVVIDVNDNPVVLAGVDDFKTEHDDLEKAVQGMPTDRKYVKILLSHCPDLLHPASEHGFDLVLAGHTHGAQVKLPVVSSAVNKFMHGEFERGWMRSKETALYINRGLGVVLIPLRLRSDAEVTVLELVPGTPPVAATGEAR